MRSIIRPGRLNRLVIAAVVLAFAAGALFVGAPWLQRLRADAALAGANAHIARADSLMSGMDVTGQAADSFSSLDGIAQAHDALAAAGPALDRAANEVRQARDAAGAASGLSLLPGWYRDYLGKKRDVAVARLDQIGKLKQAAAALEQLYGAGAVIFQAQQQMDQLTGQLQTAVTQIHADPEQAQATLTRLAQAMRAVRKQLDGARAGNDFDLLAQMSQSVGDTADAAEAAAGFAGAVASGDQSRAESAAQILETKLMGIGASADRLSRWQALNVTPLVDEIQELQSRQYGLDREAARLYRP